MDTLYFYSKSADKKPGKGANETVHDDSKYEKLSQTKDWRKVLSNFHCSPFEFEGVSV